MKNTRLIIALLSVTILAVPAAYAFVLSIARWQNGSAFFYIAIPGAATSGLLYKDAVQAAMLKWNETPFRFEFEDSYVDPCMGYERSANGAGFPNGDGNSRNSMDFRADVCGNDFGSGVLAISLNLSNSGSQGFNYLAETDIIFNTAFNWSIYNGPRQSRVDFGRVALHELGHAIGLNHELTQPAIMASNISDLDTLTADDIAGATRLYGPPVTCPVISLALNALIRDSLGEGDCRIRELYSNGFDTSFVDTYSFTLSEPTTLQVKMNSATLDSVILLTDFLLNPIEVFDDSNGSCNVNETITLPAGSYLLLTNTYVNPEKCGGNTGPYQLTITDSPYPLLGNTGNTNSSGSLSHSIFTGSSRLDTAAQSQAVYAATDKITVEARINVDPEHVGQAGKIFVLATLSNGQQYMKNSAGLFPRYRGPLSTLQPASSGLLQAEEDIIVIKGLKGSTTGLSGLGFAVYIGYSLDSAPQDIHFGGQPISFTIAP